MTVISSKQRVDGIIRTVDLICELPSVVYGQCQSLNQLVVNFSAIVQVLSYAGIGVLIKNGDWIKVVKQNSLVISSVGEIHRGGRVKQRRITERFVKREVLVARSERHVYVNPQLTIQSTVCQVCSGIGLIKSRLFKYTVDISQV